MKKILVSDFDHTLYIRQRVSEKDLQAVRRWQELGNRFVIATGREEGALRALLNREGLAPDFLICSSGARIVSWQGTVLRQRAMETDAARRLLSFLASYTSLPVDVSLENGRVQVDHMPGSEQISIYYPGIICRYSREAFWKENPTVLQVHVRFEAQEQAFAAAQALAKAGLPVEPFVNQWNLDIVHPGLGKSEAVGFLAEELGFETRVVCIGDSYNDLEMLRCYRGYPLLSADPAIRRQIPRVCEGVADCIYQELS